MPHIGKLQDAILQDTLLLDHKVFYDAGTESGELAFLYYQSGTELYEV